MMLYFGCPSASNVMTASIIEHPLITVYNATLADICHNWRWCTLLEPVPFFSTENAKFWPLLANLGYFVASLRTIWCTFTRLNNVVVSQN